MGTLSNLGVQREISGRGLGRTVVLVLLVLFFVESAVQPTIASNSINEVRERLCQTAVASKGEEGRNWCQQRNSASGPTMSVGDGNRKRSTLETLLQGDGTCFPGSAPEPADPFRCSSGSYYCDTSISLSTLTIKDSLITFASDLSVNTSLQFEEHDAQIKVLGCLSLSPSTIVSWSFGTLGLDMLGLVEDAGYTKVTLIEQGGTGCKSLETIQIQGSVAGPDCKRVTFKTIATQNQVSVDINVSFARCESGFVAFAVIIFVIAVLAVFMSLLLLCSPLGKVRACR